MRTLKPTITATATATIAAAATVAAISALQPFSPSAFCSDAPRPDTTKPNIILILVDDMGYGDIQPFGSVKNRTPNLNRMASEGLKLTSFYAAPVCTPSRAQFMTGCYAKRVSLGHGVLFPASATGLNPKEHTVADLLRAQGYTTMAVGKWHLGDQPPFLPTAHGFDNYFGLPYSNDMDRPANAGAKSPRPPLPLMRDDKPIEVITPEKQDYLEQRYTDAAVKFIRAHAGDSRPFFLYLAHTAVHLPLHPGPDFRGKSANGAYGDWVEEVDWSTGRVLDTLRELKLTDNTLVIFTSDNGPRVGVAGPLRGMKGSTLEGGMREPTIAWWPGKVPAGASTDVVTGGIDILPTFVALAGGAVPADNKIDGVDITPILLGKATQTTREAHYYFSTATLGLDAVRVGPWKLTLAAKPAGKNTKSAKTGAKSAPNSKFAPVLYNLDDDIGESRDVAAAHPDIVKRLQALADAMDKDLGAKTAAGPGVRPAGHVEHPVGQWLPGQKPSKTVIAAYYDTGEE